MNIPLIGIFTGNEPKYETRRSLCERTWVKEMRAMGCDVRFVETSPMIREWEGDDFVRVVCDDNWDSLPQKTRAFCLWAIRKPGWTHLVKMDDDTFAHPARLAAFLDALPPDIEYVGGDVGTMQGLPPYASGGGGYILSRRAAKIIANQLTDQKGHEDKRVGEILTANGVRFHADPRFVPFGMMQGWPKKDNDLITSHALSEAAWLDAWHQSQS